MNTLEKARKTHQEGNLVEAYRLYRLATIEDYNTEDAWYQMSQALLAANKIELAVIFLKKALQLNPKSWQINLLIGQNLVNLGLSKLAQPYLSEAVRYAPENTMTLYSLAFNSMMIGELDIAQDMILKALQISPDIPEFQYLLSCQYLFRGDWKNGFEYYTSRLKIQPPSWDYMNEPYWDGKTNLKGKRLHLFCEQGFGDILQFIRFLPLIPQTCKVLLLVPKEMRRLFDDNIKQPNITMYNHGSEPPFTCDYKMALCEIPKYFLKGNIPQSPYMVFPKNGPSFNKPKHIKKNIGIVWQGDPKHPNDRFRSSTLQDFIYELSIPGVELYSLQIGKLENIDTSMLGDMGIVQDLAPKIKDFADTASLLKGLDLVVTVDTSVSHLCGALGIPAHVLIPFGAVDWRWQLGEKSDWYSSLTLWRQEEKETWRDVLTRIANKISSELDNL